MQMWEVIAARKGRCHTAADCCQGIATTNFNLYITYCNHELQPNHLFSTAARCA